METITISKRKPTDVWFKTFFSILLIALIFGFSSCQDESSNELTEDNLKGLELGTPSGTSQSAPVVYFDKRRFTRTSETPIEEIVRLENPNFEHFSGDLVLKVQNGSDKQTRVSSAEITVDGETIVSQSDFSKNVLTITKRLQGLTPESVMEIKLNSTPGSFIEIWIEGALKPGRFLIDSHGGTIVSEDANLLLTVPPGTVEMPTFFIITESSSVPPLISIEECIGKTYQLEATSNVFKNPISVKWNYNSLLTSLMDPNELGVVHWDIDEGFYERISSDNDLACSEIQFYIDHFSFLKLTISKNPWHVYNFYWDIPIIKWYLDPPSGFSYLTEENIEAALNVWANETSSFIFQRIVGEENKSDANIIFTEKGSIEFLDRVSCALHIHDLLGLTCFDYSVAFGETNLDEEDHINIYLASNEFASGYTARKTIVHEIGHALGIDHFTKDNGTLPIPVMVQGEMEFHGLNWWDIMALHVHYAPAAEKEEFYSNSFSGDLSDWTIYGGSWQIQNGLLKANYGISCGSIWCPQADMILKDHFQPSGDWELSVDFTYAPDDSYNYGASGAAIIIWESPSKKIRIGIGNGGSNDWGIKYESIMPVSFCAWDGSWDNSRWNYINYGWKPRNWHTMTVDKTGNVYTVYVDDYYLWSYEDNYMNGTGKIGLQTYGPKIYDNFIIRTKD